jgi:chromosome segregation ATPase
MNKNNIEFIQDMQEAQMNRIKELEEELKSEKEQLSEWRIIFAKQSKKIKELEEELKLTKFHLRHNTQAFKELHGYYREHKQRAVELGKKVDMLEGQLQSDFVRYTKLKEENKQLSKWFNQVKEQGLKFEQELNQKDEIIEELKNQLPALYRDYQILVDRYRVYLDSKGEEQ